MVTHLFNAIVVDMIWTQTKAVKMLNSLVEGENAAQRR